MSTTILLTSTVNVQAKPIIYQRNKQERINTYLKAIRQWLTKTNFKIVLVENSGYTFPELQEEKEFFKDRFEIISFQESQFKEAKYLEREEGKGGSEMYAIHFAYYFSIFIKNSIFIIKVTARFFIPELEDYLATKDLNMYDGLCQNDVNRCEMVGSHIKNFHIIFNKYLINEHGNYEQHVENIYKMRMRWFNNILQCKVFDIEPTQRGGVPEIFYNI
jgi:hypothetical protein